ncbi:MAG TPA: cellulose biosynthesis protein BcsS [Candidatus Eisenbacteria bacterium]
MSRRARGGCRRARALGLALLLAGTAPGVAGAAALEGLGGWEGDGFGQGYGFLALGAIIPARSNASIMVRAQASYLYYDFESSGATTRVISPGATLLAGVRFAGERGSLALAGGGEARRERRQPPAPAAETWDTPTGGVGQLEADAALAPRWHVTLIANYAGAARYLFSRAALRWQATNPDWSRPTTMTCGLELTGQGNDETRGVQGGALADLALVPRRLSLAVHGGYKDAWSPGERHRRGAYFGAGFYRRF